MAETSPTPTSGRRRFLQRAVAAGAAVFCGTPVMAGLPARELGFLNLHTGERLRVPYWENGRYIPAALGEINKVLRDHRANAVHTIDTALLDLLVRLQGAVANTRSFEVISGYRAPATNNMMRAHGHAVSQGSMHLFGKAIDVRLPGCDLARLHRAAVALKGGGVGLYRGEDFIHVDTGRVRYW
jgi:uncharacterized protein YcbK (DUF882 family)